MSVPLSMVLIVKNEEKRIRTCLETFHGWADEIIIVDDHSTDKTREICAEYTDKVFTRRMLREGVQRNFGASKARHDWVMQIDSDEKMTPELQKEIEELFSRGHDGKVAFWCPRKNYLGKHWLQHGGWYPAPHLKLYNRCHTRWKEVPQDVVHPGSIVDEGCKGGQLKNHLIHQNFRNIEDFIAKTNNQTTLEAIKWHLSGKKMKFGKAMWRTMDRFFRRFLGKAGWKDGFFGFAAAALSGFYQFAAYCKYREIIEDEMYLKERRIGEEEEPNV